MQLYYEVILSTSNDGKIRIIIFFFVWSGPVQFVFPEVDGYRPLPKKKKYSPEEALPGIPWKILGNPEFVGGS